MTTKQIPTGGTAPVATQGMRELMHELRRHKWLIPVVALVVTGLVTAWTVRQPKVYESVVTLEYDPNPSQPLGRSVDDPSRGQSLGYWDTQEFYQTQNFILRSRALAERIVRTLALQSNAEFIKSDVGLRASAKSADGQLSVSLGAAADVVLGRLDVRPIRDTRLVRVSFRDTDAERAQLIANTLAESYIDKSLEDRLGTSSRALEWLSHQMQNLKGELEESELALYKFREQNDSLAASLGERQKIIGNQLQSYSEALTRIRTRKVEVSARLAVLKERLANTADPIEIRADTFAADSEAVTLRQQYRNVSTELDQLLITYADKHPSVQTLRAARDALFGQLQKHLNTVVQGVVGELQELEKAEQGVKQALAEVNQQGLALSLREIEYTRLERERSNKAELFGLVMQRAAQTDLTSALRLASARLVDRAVLPIAPVSPRVQLTIGMGLFIGLGLGVVAALLAAQFDNKVRNVADLESRGMAILGLLPKVAAGRQGPGKKTRPGRRSGRVADASRDLIVHLQPRSTLAECCRTIRTNITFQSADRVLQALAVTSSMPRDGKTMVSTSLAITLAQSGRRTLLVDTDLRKPRIHKAFGLPGGVGLTSVLAGEAGLDEAAQQTDVPGLLVLPCGPIPPNPSELLHTRRFAEVVTEMRGKFDSIIFDTSPLGAVTDGAIISTHVDGTILVVRCQSTKRAGVDSALRQLTSVSARVVGAVFNDVDVDGAGAYYSDYRAYYGEDEEGLAPGRGLPASK